MRIDLHIHDHDHDHDHDDRFERLERLIERLLDRHDRRPVLFHFNLNTNQGAQKMVTLPPITIFSQEKQPMDLNPVRGGQTEVDETAHATVTSSDESQVGIEVVNADTNQYNILTPLDSGSATITISGAGFEDAQFLFSYVPFVAGQWNPTFGAAVSDAPPAP